MAESTLAERVAAANAPLTDPERNRVIGSGTPRFELYHFALSVCSHKVRTVLAEKDALLPQPRHSHPAAGGWKTIIPTM